MLLIKVAVVSCLVAVAVVAVVPCLLAVTVLLLLSLGAVIYTAEKDGKTSNDIDIVKSRPTQ